VKCRQGDRKTAEKQLTLTQLQAAVEKAPDDVDLSPVLAEQYWKRRRARDARELAERSKSGHEARAGVSTSKRNCCSGPCGDEAAQKLLEDAAAADPPEPRVLKIARQALLRRRAMGQSRGALRTRRKLEPFRDELAEDLARVAKQTGATRQADRRVIRIGATERDELDSAGVGRTACPRPGGGGSGAWPRKLWKST